MVKKLKLSLVLFVLLITMVLPTQSLANNQTIKVIVDGKQLILDQTPVIQNGRTLVPLRSIFEALEAQVDYNSATKQITATKGSTTVQLTLGSRIARINGQHSELDVPAQVINQRTLVPVRFVSEALGDEINYNSNTKEVTVVTKIAAINSIVVKDVNDYGDGRDLEVSFTRLGDESKVDHYRIYVVKTSKASSFTLNTANNLASTHYTVVQKGNATAKHTLSATTLDSDGAKLQSDIAYTVFVMAVSNTNIKSKNTLSQPSSSITMTLKNKVPAVTGLVVRDVSEYGDGRDLEVSFTKITDETHLDRYRVFVVRSNEASQFTLSKAKSVAATNYTNLAKTGSNKVEILSSTARDVNGATIKNDIAYKVFVMSVGNTSAGYGDSLSAASSEIILKTNVVDITVKNVTVKDVKDHGDGRDLEVSFTISANESRVSEYRVMVVPSTVSTFNLDAANKVASGRYSVVSKTGSNRTITLSETARDINGNTIKDNVAYRVFVLSFGGQANGNRNYLSAASSTITLKNNITTTAVTGLTATDIADNKGANDIQVSFNKVSDETNVNEYRVMVVKAGETFNLTKANVVKATSYAVVAKTGSNHTITLPSSLLDTDDQPIREDITYKIYVLTVSNSGANTGNALSAGSSNIKLTTNVSPIPVVNVTANVTTSGDIHTLNVGFTKPSVENHGAYEIFIVKEGSSFTAANIGNASKLPLSSGANSLSVVLNDDIKDTNGDKVVSGNNYRIYVVSIPNGTTTKYPSLSLPSNTFSF